MAEAQVRLRHWWGQVSDADPRKQLIERELTNRDDINDPAEIWGRAVPIKIHGDALPLSRTSN